MISHSACDNNLFMFGGFYIIMFSALDACTVCATDASIVIIVSLELISKSHLH